MRVEALEYLACPRCGAGLSLDDPVRAGQEIIAGRLACAGECGAYPIEDGVPRLLPGLAGAALARISHRPSAATNGDEKRELDATDDQAETRRAFGAQWKQFKYGGTTWGITLEERLPVVLHELGWTPRQLDGKVILDAGCGNGTLSEGLAGRGATVVALDLSDSVLRAHAHCRAPGLHFVQGNLFYPPLKPGAFDAIYSCGVFHHTPDTRRAFRTVAPALKKAGDSRFFVWLYAERGALFNATVEPAMKLTRRMPERLLVPFCHALAPVVEASSRLLTRFGAAEHAPRTLRDRAIQLHDLLSPRYVWYHDFEEARRWAIDLGFEQVAETAYEPRGDQPGELRSLLNKYRTVCRPGFGMLCRGPARG